MLSSDTFDGLSGLVPSFSLVQDAITNAIATVANSINLFLIVFVPVLSCRLFSCIALHDTLVEHSIKIRSVVPYTSSSSRGCRKDLEMRSCNQPTLKPREPLHISASRGRFLHSYWQKPYNASRFPFEIRCKNTLFIWIGKINFTTMQKNVYFCSSFYALY